MNSRLCPLEEASKRMRGSSPPAMRMTLLFALLSGGLVVFSFRFWERAEGSEPVLPLVISVVSLLLIWILYTGYIRYILALAKGEPAGYLLMLSGFGNAADAIRFCAATCVPALIRTLLFDLPLGQSRWSNAFAVFEFSASGGCAEQKILANSRSLLRGREGLPRNIRRDVVGASTLLTLSLAALYALLFFLAPAALEWKTVQIALYVASVALFVKWLTVWPLSKMAIAVQFLEEKEKAKASC